MRMQLQTNHHLVRQLQPSPLLSLVSSVENHLAAPREGLAMVGYNSVKSDKSRVARGSDKARAETSLSGYETVFRALPFRFLFIPHDILSA